MLPFADASSPAAGGEDAAGVVGVDPISLARKAPEVGAWALSAEDFHSRKNRWEDTLTFEVDARDVSVLDVATPHGDIVVMGDDSDTIRVSARRVVRSSDEDKGATYREGFRPVARVDGDVLAVGVLRPEGEKERRPRHVKEAVVDFTIAVPPRLAEGVGPAIHLQSGHGDIVAKNVRQDMTSLRTGHGDVAVAEVAGDVDLHSGHGDLAVTDSTLGRLNAHTGHGDVVSSGVRGSATVRSGHGNIRLKEVQGNVEARTGHGDLRVEARGGAIHLNTGHGDLSIVGSELDGLTARSGNGDLHAELSGSAGAVHLGTGNGDISLEADGAESVSMRAGRGDLSCQLAGRVAGEVNLDTGHGEVALSVGADVALTLDASTGSGTVASSLDLDDVERSKDGRRLRGSRLGGGSPVVLRSGNGDIDVRAR